MAVIGINYTEGVAEEYESVYLKFTGGTEYVFGSGNFVKDWYNAKKTFVQSEDEDTLIGIFCCSSSVDHFIMDGAKYDSAYMRMIDGVPTLLYEYDEKGWEFFAPEGTTPTWEELKNMCKDLVEPKE